MVQTHTHTHEEDATAPLPSQKWGIGPQILKTFYSCTIESILTGCFTASYGNSTTLDRMELQRVVRQPSTELPAIQDIYIRWCGRKAWKIVKDPNHPSHRLFSLFLHGKPLWSPI
jgi:gmma-aminobutyric acid receptor subunit gamma